MSTTTRTATPLPYDTHSAPEWLLGKFRGAKRLAFNLAPIRYAFVAENGGPITQIDYGHGDFLGERWHLSRALLREEFQHPMGKRLRLFHPADGSGVGKTRLEARSKAISEALERWAYFSTSSGPDRTLYGYPYADSTKGMAAFPGMLPRQARRLAVAEAFEYFTIDAWWGGSLQHWQVERDDATIVFIEQPHFSGCVAVAIRPLGLDDYAAAYGMGSGATPAEAEVKAQLEACRLQTLLELRDRSVTRAKPILPAEQQLLFRASHEGYRMVRDRLASSPWRSAPQPKIVFDGPVSGPWNKYTHVWRYALEPIHSDHELGCFAA